MNHLKQQGVPIDYCIIGEPSGEKQVGDTLKIGRRGSLTGRFQVNGQQGHIAYPQRADNPIHRALPALQALATQVWDPEPSRYFPETRLQFSQLHAGTTAVNVIPGTLQGAFNFRFSNMVSPEALQRGVEAHFQAHGCSVEIAWEFSGKPFLTETGRLIDACKTAIFETQGITPNLSTDGGTSDGRFIAPEGIEVVELGVCNHRIHAINEYVPLADLTQLQAIYERVLSLLLA